MAGLRNFEESNAALIARCQKGDRKGFFELYNLYAKAMFNVAIRILNNKSEAEEVLQDSFLKAFTRINAYDPRYAFGVWVKKIVVNGSLDILKKKRVALVPLDDSLLAISDLADAADLEYEVEYDAETIKRCLCDLPDGYRTILSLFLFENYSHREISGLLGISEGTSKSQYSRARKRLGEMLKQTITNER